MKRPLLAVLVTTTLFVLACSGGGGSPRPGMDAGKPGYRAHFDATCEGIQAELEADAKAALDKYKFKNIFLSGTVKSEVSAGKVLLAGNGGSHCEVRPFKGSATKDAARFKKGGQAEFLCKLDTFDKIPVFKDCSPYKEKK